MEVKKGLPGRNGVKAGYKQTEVGVIPEDWEVVYLGDMAIKVGSGITPTGGERVYKKEGRPFLRSQNVGWGLLLMDDIAFIDDFTHNIFKGTEIQPDDVFLNITGASIGRSAVADIRVQAGNVNQHVCIIRTVNSKLNPRLLNLFLLSKAGQKQIDSFQAGGNRQGLNFGQIRSFQIPLPPTIAEQTAIAAVLNNADALIQSLGKLIAKKRLTKQGAMQKLLKPKKGWVVKKLGEVAILKARIGWQGLTTAEYKETGDYYLITGTDFKNGFIDWENCFYVEYLRYKQDRNIQVKENDVLVTKDGTIGKVAFLKQVPKPATLNSGVFVIRPIEQSFYPEFFYYLLLSEHFAKFLSQLSAGSTINHLYQKDFVHFEFKVPKTNKEQARIATILSDMDAEISALETKLTKYKQVKQGMMQNLLTGKIRLVENATAKQKVIAINKKPSRKNHNWQINEAVVIAVLTKEFGSDKFPLGRKRYTKLSYLLHRHIERRAEGYLKKAAGPYNPDTRYKGPEKIAQTRGYIKYHSRDKYNGYVTDDNIKEAVAYFNKWYGPEALRWLEQFRYKDKDQLELLTTVDMAVQDLLQNNKEVSITSVKTLVKSHNEWRAKLKRSIFSDNNISTAIRLSEDLFGY